MCCFTRGGIIIPTAGLSAAGRWGEVGAQRGQLPVLLQALLTCSSPRSLSLAALCILSATLSFCPMVSGFLLEETFAAAAAAVLSAAVWQTRCCTCVWMQSVKSFDTRATVEGGDARLFAQAGRWWTAEKPPRTCLRAKQHAYELGQQSMYSGLTSQQVLRFSIHDSFLACPDSIPTRLSQSPAQLPVAPQCIND